jgi:hypothetical protein
MTQSIPSKSLLVVIVLIGLSMTGCRNQRLSEVHNNHLDWSAYCFDGFGQRAQELAAGQHHNCGFFSISKKYDHAGWFYRNLSKGLTCVDEAYKSQQAFIYGIHAFWRDTYVCEAYIGSNDGRLYRLFYDFDVRGGMDTTGKHDWYVEEVCDAISIEEQIRVPHYMNHIVDSGCRRLDD